jgi:MscS family membrane protein
MENLLLEMIKKYSSFLFILLLIFNTPTKVNAQFEDFEEEDLPVANLSTPYHTIVTHLGFLQENNYHPELSAMAVLNEDLSKEEAKILAVKLKQIFDGRGIYINVYDIPHDPDYQDSITTRQRYVITKAFPQIYLQKVGKNWVYSKKTVASIDDLHKEVYPFGTDKLLNLLPKIGTKVYFGMHLWQLVGLLALIVLSILIHKIFSYLLEKIIHGVLHRAGYKEIASNYVLPVARPFSYFVVFVLLMLFVPVLQLPISTARYIIIGLRAALPFFATLIMYHFVDIVALYLQRLASREDNNLNDQLIPLLRRVLKIFVVIVGGLFVMQNLNINITALLAGISITGLAFALAAQDTIKNFFGSIMIFIDKPFKIGDWITSGDIDGTVEEVGFRSTRIRTFRNSVTYVPNGKLADMTVDNHGLRVYRRFYTKIAITYDTPADLIETFVAGLRAIVDRHPETRKDFYQIHFNDMSDFSLQIMFYIFFAVPTWNDELRCRHEILLEIIKLAEELNIRFAFPTQTLHLETMPGKEALTPVYNESVDELKLKLGNYLKGEKHTPKVKV